MMYISSHI